MSGIVLCALLFGLFPACSPFADDGAADSILGNYNGYFYLLDCTSVNLVMLDMQMRELQRWSLLGVASDSSLQGITFDGTYLWIASAGSTDRIFQIDVSGSVPVVLKSFEAPPLARGTVRDLAWDGSSLWALNSGSGTYATPAALYKLNPLDGSIISEYPLESPEPRGLTFVKGFSDTYGKGPEAGLYFTDVTWKKVMKFRYDRPFFDTAFAAPVPPRGMYNIYPVGITTDGLHFWLVNSSNTADHLYKLNYTGGEEGRFDLPYDQPGPIAWASADLRRPTPPTIAAVTPNTGVRGSSMQVDTYGTGYKPGIAADFGVGITVASTSFISTTQVRVNITIASNAPLGKRSITLTNADARSVTGDSLFTVTAILSNPHLWLLEQDLDSLYQMRLNDTTVVRQFDTRVIAPAGSPQGIAFDGTHLWLCASGTDKRLYQIDTTGGILTTGASFPAPAAAGTLRGIVWESGSLWLAISAPGKIYKLNPSTGVVLDSASTPGSEPRGITFANGTLYCDDTTLDSVFAYNATSKTWAGVFATPTPAGGTTSNRFATGLTWDGANFWIANSTGSFDHVYKLAPNGTVLQSITAPRVGPAQITGIVYTPN